MSMVSGKAEINALSLSKGHNELFITSFFYVFTFNDHFIQVESLKSAVLHLTSFTECVFEIHQCLQHDLGLC